MTRNDPNPFERMAFVLTTNTSPWRPRDDFARPEPEEQDENLLVEHRKIRHKCPVGLKVGYLTVIGEGPRKLFKNCRQAYRTWRCVCICGLEREFNMNVLRRGDATSCGCRRYVQNTGQFKLGQKPPPRKAPKEKHVNPHPWKDAT